MTKSWMFFVLFTCAATASHSAQAQDAASDGKKLYMTKTCIACHGRNGAKPIQTYPALASLDKAYLLQQMKDIKSGARIGGKDERGNARTQGMKDIMHLVNDAEMAEIAAWLSQQPPAQLASEVDPEKVKLGADLYLKKGCRTCHGVEGKKPLVGYPLIAGQKPAYTVFQMTEIQSGLRVNGKAKTMVPFVKPLKPDEIAALSDYLASLGGAPTPAQ